MNEQKQRILFLCTGNSCRSHMAEGLLRAHAGSRYECLSAGSKPSGFVHPLAIEAMQEIGIDVSAHRSKSIDEFLPPKGEPPDLIVSVCEAAAGNCPLFPGNVNRLNWAFDDPAKATGTAGDRMAAFRRIRDEIREAIEKQFSDAD